MPGEGLGVGKGDLGWAKARRRHDPHQPTGAGGQPTAERGVGGGGLDRVGGLPDVHGLGSDALAATAARTISLMADGTLDDFRRVVHPAAVNREASSEPPACRGRGPDSFWGTARSGCA
ncbi:MAG TPA: hypothetical protein VEZ42_15675, partial [Pseudonocardia sp.]|nr:hypothetical protein [Pseudonocardia sp.]